MAKAVTRLFDSHSEALSAVGDLEAAGIAQDSISIVSNNADNRHGDHQHSGRGPLQSGGDNDAAEGAGKGATTGGLIGGAGGLLAGLGMLAIPGLGPVVAAGWLVSTAVGAAVGAAAGGAAGGLLGALKDAGHSDEEANVYAEGVRRGGTLVSVKVEPDQMALAEEILNGRRGVEATARGQQYRDGGWDGFDPAAEPYSADQVATARLTSGEGRSFAGGSSQDDSLEARPEPRRDGEGAVTPIRGSDI